MSILKTSTSNDIALVEIHLDHAKLTRVQYVFTPIGILELRETGELAVNLAGFVDLTAKISDDPAREFGFEQLTVNARSMGRMDDNYWLRFAESFKASVTALDARPILEAAHMSWSALDRLRAQRDYAEVHDDD